MRVKSKNFRMVTFNVLPEIYEQFLKVLPQNMTASEALRELIQTFVENERVPNGYIGLNEKTELVGINNKPEFTTDKNPVTKTQEIKSSSYV
jgi:hypothetical protein